MLIKSKHEGYQAGIRLYPCDDGGGGGGAAQTTQTSDLPDWAKGYAKDVLGRGQALTSAPYQAYGGERQAQFTPLQQQAFQGAANLQPSAATGQGINIANQAAQRALNTGYDAGQFQNQFQGPEAYNQSQFQNQFQAPGQYQSGQFGADRVQAPNLQNYQMQGPANVRSQGYNAASMQAAQSGYNPQLSTFQMGPAERVETQSFAQPGSADAYMSPYMQNVVGIQQREAQRAADIAGTQRGAEAVKSGAFGGSRQAIMEAEAARNLATQKGDIQATGLQAAFQQAQGQFNTEQQARLAAQQANQQAGLTTGQQNLASQQATQQLGTQTGLQTALANLSAEQQTNVQNQAAQNQARGMNAQQAMQAALANQQAGLTTGQQNLAANLSTQQLGAGQNMQAQLANQQQGMDAQRMAEQSRQFGAGQGLTAAQLQAQFGMSAQQAQAAEQQFAAQQAMTSAQQRAQFGQSAQQLAEQSRQYGAGLGLQGIQAAMTGAGQLGSLGSQQFSQGMDANLRQQQFGTQQQQQVQSILGNQYQDFLNQQRAPYQQLEYMSNLLRGTPSGSTQQLYTAGPSAASQLLGAGTALGGAYLMGGRKEGGVIRSYAGGGRVKKAAGLNELALSKI
jgi:hypothetical protein